MSKAKIKTVWGICVNSGNGQHLDYGNTTVRELTVRERRKMPSCVARQEGLDWDGKIHRVYMSVDSPTTNGGYYVLAAERDRIATMAGRQK